MNKKPSIAYNYMVHQQQKVEETQEAISIPIIRSSSDKTFPLITRGSSGFSCVENFIESLHRFLKRNKPSSLILLNPPPFVATPPCSIQKAGSAWLPAITSLIKFCADWTRLESFKFLSDRFIMSAIETIRILTSGESASTLVNMTTTI